MMMQVFMSYFKNIVLHTISVQRVVPADFPFIILALASIAVLKKLKNWKKMKRREGKEGGGGRGRKRRGRNIRSGVTPHMSQPNII